MTSRTKLVVWGLIFVGLILLVVMIKSGKDESASIQNELSKEAMMDWKEFRPTQGDFIVSLPQLPQHASEIMPLAAGQGVIKYDMFLSVPQESINFMISMIQYPNDFAMANPEEFLDNVVKGVVKAHANNKLVKEEKGLFLNNSSRDFEVCNNGVCWKSRVFVVGKVLYMLTLVTKDHSDTDMLFNKFAGSFTLQNADEPQLSPAEIK